jgi:hypothetical protein
MGISPQAVGRILCACVVMTFLGALLGGCESYSAPVLSVAKVEPVERTQDGCSMLFTLDARNDNDDALPLRTVVYRVDLNGQEVFHGERSAEATLRRLGIQQLRLPAAVQVTQQTSALIGGPAHYRLSGSMYYVTPGRLAETLFDAGVRTPSVDFAFEGDLDLSGAKFVSSRPPTPSIDLPKAEASKGESVAAPTEPPAPTDKP